MSERFKGLKERLKKVGDALTSGVQEDWENLDESDPRPTDKMAGRGLLNLFSAFGEASDPDFEKPKSLYDGKEMMAFDPTGVMGTTKAVGKAAKTAKSLPMDKASRMARAKEMGFDLDTKWYHGTTFDINEFKPDKQGMSFFTESPGFADGFSTFRKTNESNFDVPVTPNVIPAHLSVKNTFDFSNPEHLNSIKDALPQRFSVNSLKRGDWEVMEHPAVAKAIKDAGYDSMYVVEGGYKNIGVFDPSKIRSKFAKFDPKDAKSGKITAGLGGAAVGGSLLSGGEAKAQEINMEPQDKKKSQLESGVRGAAQGLSMGYADEIAGGAGAAYDVATGESNFSDIMDAYRKNRDDSRKQYKKAAKDNPKTFKGGEAAGVVGSFMLPGVGALRGAKAGAALGAAAGIGRSESDLTQGDVGGVAQDAAVGAALGAAGGKAFEKIAPRFGSLAEKMGLKKAAMSADDEFRSQLNPDLYKLQNTGKVTPKMKSEVNQLDAAASVEREVIQRDLMRKAEEAGFNNLDDYFKFKQDMLLNKIRSTDDTIAAAG